MLRKIFTVIFAIATSAGTALADGFEVNYVASGAGNGVEGKGTYQIAELKKTANGTMSLAEAIAAVNSYVPQSWENPVYMVRIIGDMSGENAALSAIGKEKVDLSMATGMTDFSVFANNDAVKYVILPNGTAKEDVNTLGGDVDAAASALPVYSYSDGWQYADPNTGENVMTASYPAKEVNGTTYVNLQGTGTYKAVPTAVNTVYVKADDTEYIVSEATPVLYKGEMVYGVNDGAVLSNLTADTYYVYNGQNRYDGSLLREEDGKQYGNTGSAVALSSKDNAYIYNKDGKSYVYAGEDIYVSNDKNYGLVGNGENVVELEKNTEYRSYGVDGATVDVNKYTITEGPFTEWGKTYYKTAQGVPLFVVNVYTYGTDNTKYEGDVFVLGSKFYGYISENPFAEISKAAEGAVTYYATFTQEVYTGKLYGGDNDSLLGGTGEDVMLTSVTDYYIADAKYDGPVTEDSKGVADWNSSCFQLAISYVHTYVDLAGNVKTVKTSSKLSEIDMSNTYDDLWIAAEACQVPSATATSVELTAYVSNPGSLYNTLARWEILNNQAGVANNGWTYTVSAVNSLTLSGSVNAADMANGENYLTEEGNAYVWENGAFTLPEGKKAASAGVAAMTGNNLTHIDLKDAVFAQQTDMNFNLLNRADNLESVVLPTSENMTLIPAGAFSNLHKVAELCIPYNYEVIGAEAFYDTHALMHIYTTDPADATIVDNGKYTYTFSANLKEIQSLGTGKKATFFGSAIEQITDIYNLATKAPKCGAGAFCSSMTHCNGGFAGNWAHPISRDNYKNSGERMMCILHYPATCVEEEAKNYTDITRVYTLGDETGAVYGDGSPIMWPRHNEFLRSYNQAVNGVTWDAWQEYETDGSWAAEVIGSLDVAQKYPIDASKTYNQADYQGWHEFVLVGNNNTRSFDPQQENTAFVQRDWLTVCVPYNLRKSQVLSILGVKSTEGTNTIKMLDGTEQTVNEDVYPDIRTLSQVSRSVNNGKMILHISKSLANDEEGKSWNVKISDDAQGFTYEELEGDDPIVMKGGHPYLIRAYVPAEWTDKIKNIGMYIMAVAESANKAAQKSRANTDMPYMFNTDATVKNVMLPCVKPDIQALNADAPITYAIRESAEQKDARYVYKDAGRTAPAYYHFIGTYTSSKIPQYGYYIGKAKDGSHKFSRTTKTTFTWAAYSAVIVGLSSPEYKGFNDTETSSKLQNITIDAHNSNDLIILEGETTNPALAGKPLSIVMDESGAAGETTGIISVEENNAEVSDGKVYNLNGQLAGKSLDGMSKGVYIINGEKRIVK